NNVANIPSFVPRAASVPADSRNQPASVTAGSVFPAGSRNRPATVSAGRHVPAGSSTRPAPVSAGRPFSAGWRNHAARPMTRPTSHYFQHFSRPGCYNQLYMDEGRWGTAENPHKNKDLGIVDSGCSRSMTGNKEKLDDFVKIIGAFMKVAAFGVHAVNFLMYVVPTGRVKVPAGRYVVPTGKDNVIVSAGRSKVIPAGRTIFVLVVLCLLRVDSIVS
ncbi:hypothetical protein Tco_0686993, partial [Tanacetum coccineum]